MISHAYLTLYPSRAFYLKHVYTRNQPQTSRENVRRSRIERYNNRKARSLDVLPISWSQSNCPKLCIHLPLSPKSSKYWPTLDRRDQMNGNAIPYEKLANTEIPCRKWTKYRYRIYDRWRLLNVVSISRVFFFFFISSMYTPEINPSLREKTWEDLELMGTTIEKPGHWMSYHIIG